MAELIINRVLEGLFEHELDGVQTAIDNRPNLTTFKITESGVIVLHFKTKNGAPLVKNQEIHPEDITITDTFGGTPDQTGFTDAVQVWNALGNLGYFEGYAGAGGGAGGIEYFKQLLDVFPNSFQGQNNKVFVVNEAMNRLEPVFLYNYSRLIQMQDVESILAQDIPNGYVLTVITVPDAQGVNQKIFGFRPQSIMSQTPNGFITLGTFELTDGVFTADTAWSWSQDGVQYGNLEEYEYTIEDLPDGSSRFYVFHTQPNDNTFSVTVGVISTDGNALKPQIPLGAIELTTIFVNGSTISEPTEPVIGADYIAKKSFGWTTKNITGSNTFLTITDFTNAYNIVNNALVSIDGVQTTGLPNTLEYDGQLIWIKNGSTTTFVLNANVDDFNLMPFKFPTAGNFTMAVGSVACFKRFSNIMELVSYNIEISSYIKSNEDLSLARRNGDFLYGVLDQYTGEEMTLSKVTGTPTIDNVIYFELGDEIFRRNSDYVNLKWFGAKGDGITDDLIPIQKAFSYSKIIVPEGVYLLSDYTNLGSNKTIEGVRGKSVFLLEEDGFQMFQILNESNITLKDITFKGSEPDIVLSGGIPMPVAGKVDSYSDALNKTNIGTGTGLGIYQGEKINITGCEFRNFGAWGVLVNQSGNTFEYGVKMTDNYFHDNYLGLELSDEAEYSSYLGNSFTRNEIGVYQGSGNNLFTNNHLDKNRVGLVLAGGYNNAHGSFGQCSFNHNALFGAIIDSITNGESFEGCQFWFGNIYIKDSNGVNLQGGLVGLSSILIEGGGQNLIQGIGFSGGNINENWNGVASNVISRDNFNLDGSDSFLLNNQKGRTFEKKTIIKGDNNSDVSTSQFEIQGKTSDAFKAMFSLNTEDYYFEIQARILGYAEIPIILNKSGGKVKIGNPTDGGSIFQVDGTAQISNATASNHAIPLGQVVSNTNSSDATLNLTTPSITNYYQHTGTVATWTLPPVSGNEKNTIICTNKGTVDILINSNTGSNDIWEAGSAVNTINLSREQAIRFYCDGVNWNVL